jgi:SAM-dependent methyltransferase
VYSKIQLGCYDSLAKAYRFSRPSYSKDIIKLLKFFLSNYKRIKSLDLGSGTGIFTKEIAKISYHVTGVELSKEMIKNAYKLKNVKYLNQSADNISFKEKFDIFSSASCFHWFNNSKIVKLVNANLKDNGLFIICYNSRKISKNPFLKKVEKKIYSLNKNFKSRISSGQSNFVKKKIIDFAKKSKLKGPIFFEFSQFGKVLMSLETN